MTGSGDRHPRLAGERILLFSTADWDTPLPTNKHHIARRLARKNRVLFVETLGTRAPRMGDSTDWGRIGRRLLRAWDGPVKRAPRLWSLSPLVIPRWSTDFQAATNRMLFRLSAGSAIAPFARGIAWVYSPYAVHLLPKSGPRLVVYHMVDDLAAVPGADASALRAAEEQLLGRADIVFCTEKSLHDRASRFARRAVHAPNVADAAHFGDGRDRGGASATLLARLRALPHPRVLFSGNLASHKIDVDLLEALVRARRDIRFVLLGPVWEADPQAERFRRLRSEPNVLMGGHVAYEELPPFLHAADALLIPYARTAATQAVFPLKFFEYAATGRPIVASEALQSLRPYGPICALAPNTPEAWSAAIDAALRETGDRPALRRAVARRNTWDTRLAQMEAAIVPLLERRPRTQ